MRSTSVRPKRRRQVLLDPGHRPKRSFGYSVCYITSAAPLEDLTASLADQTLPKRVRHNHGMPASDSMRFEKVCRFGLGHGQFACDLHVGGITQERQGMPCICSDAGMIPNILVRAIDIKAGNAAMYFPEANVLVPTTVDPASKTPAFKSVLVAMAAENGKRKTRIVLRWASSTCRFSSWQRKRWCQLPNSCRAVRKPIDANSFAVR